MKRIILGGILVTLLGTVSCQQKEEEKAEETIQIETKETLAVEGVVKSIENGKDGYMATLQSGDGQEYIVTISIVNLQKGASEFHRYEVGDTIAVEGEFWEDAAGAKYIMALELKGK